MARYKMRQKMISLGEDFTIEDESGHRAFEVDGKVMRLRETSFKDEVTGLYTRRFFSLRLEEEMSRYRRFHHRRRRARLFSMMVNTLRASRSRSGRRRASSPRDMRGMRCWIAARGGAARPPMPAV